MCVHEEEMREGVGGEYGKKSDIPKSKIENLSARMVFCAFCDGVQHESGY